MNTDKCHICLEQKYLKRKPIELCGNTECSGFICDQCWIQLLQNDFQNCPICREELSPNSKNYQKIQQKLVRRNLLKDSIKHIIFYLVFYSMGLFTIATLLLYSLSFSELLLYINNLKFHFYLLSMITFPIVGFITWYISILIISYLISIFIRCKNLTSNDLEYNSDDNSDDNFDNYIDNPI